MCTSDRATASASTATSPPSPNPPDPPPQLTARDRLLTRLALDVAVPDTDAVEQVAERLGGLSDFVHEWLTGIVPLHRLRMWPLGFHDFLEPILTANPYTDAFPDIELLDEPAVVQGIESALYDTETRDRYAAARAAYLTLLDAQVDTRAAFTEAASRAGLTL